MRVHLATLGCRLNEAELQTWSRQFRESGFTVVDAEDEPELVVLNTCAVTAEAVRKSRQLTRRHERGAPDARLVLTGCYASLQPRQARELGVELVVENSDKDRLVEIVRDRLALPTLPSPDIQDSHLPVRNGRHRAFIKVQDGCRYRCTYCVITLARGNERSRPIAEVIAEINALHEEGYQEAVLTGIHLGGFGSDQATDLRALIEAVLERTSIPRLRLGSLEPWDLPPDFWSLFSNPRLLPHLHLPMQSGADSVLRRMARRCRTAEFRALARAARDAVPDINLTTDLIVGFPGETDAEFEQTMAFARDLGFGHIHIFAYSPREGTKAAGLPGPVPREIQHQRSERLHALAEHSRLEFVQRQIGATHELLLETRVEGGWGGYTPNYLKTRLLENDPGLENRVVNARITGTSADGLLLAEPASAHASQV